MSDTLFLQLCQSMGLRYSPKIRAARIDYLARDKRDRILGGIGHAEWYPVLIVANAGAESLATHHSLS